MINKVYLHWTAGRYSQLFDDYHICIDGEGKVHKMGELEEKKSHTYLRNSHSVGIAICCCYGAGITLDRDGSGEGQFTINWGSFPPREVQLLAMAFCVAAICRKYGLEINEKTVMTHAEVADKDGYGVFDRDPDLRWDLFRLPGIETPGGDYIRTLARRIWEEKEEGNGVE